MSPRSQEGLDEHHLTLPEVFPRDLLALIPLRLPLAFVGVETLTTDALGDWLARRRISYVSGGPHRRLHGALVARSGRGIVFIDSTDEPAEQQLTAAHETAHFLEDHVRPRQNALDTFGDSIRPVLDGHRAPTREECVSSVLNRVPIGMHVHLMTRGRTGAICSWEVEKREQRADRLALQLLAPAKAALELLRRSPSLSSGGELNAAALLSREFALPLHAARLYAALLLNRSRPRPKLSERLLGENQ
jgi:hypothetical protein